MTTETTDDTELDTAEKIRAGLKTDDDTNVDDDTGEGEKETQEKKDEKAKPSDAEAKLLKEVMKHKEAAKKAAADLKALNEKFDGLDVDAIRTMLADKEKAEETALEKKGEYDRLLAKQREAADAKIKAEKERADAAAAEKTRLLSTIEDLTTGQAFSNSKFVTEKLTLTPNKAKALYKSHFEFEDGKMVAYDKPKGDSNRTMIVDATGEAADFETAIASIIEADPDKDYLIKSEQKPGSGSKPSNTEKQKQKPDFADTTEKMAAGLEEFFKKSGKK